MAEPREQEHDPHDPRHGSTNPTGPHGAAEQEQWQKSQHGEEAMREASTKAADETGPEARDDE